MKKEENFMLLQQLFFYITLALTSLSVVFFVVFVFLIDNIGAVPDIFGLLTMLFILISMGLVIFHIVRMILYFVRYKNQVVITKTVIGLILSPITVFLFFIVYIVFVLSVFT